MPDTSTNTVAPWLGQGLPVYPQVNSLCRVSAQAVLGTNVYPGFAQQFTPPLSLRDRESVFIWEPNNIALGPGVYDCRLVGSYAGLPLYATNCCISGPFPPLPSVSPISSSSSSSGPFVLSTVPASGAVGVSPLTLIKVKFNRPIQAATINFLVSGSIIPGTTSYDSANNTAVFTPNAPLPFNDLITVTISGVLDLNNNAMPGPYTWTFTTGVISSSPSPSLSPSMSPSIFLLGSSLSSLSPSLSPSPSSSLVLPSSGVFVSSSLPPRSPSSVSPFSRSPSSVSPPSSSSASCSGPLCLPLVGPSDPIFTYLGFFNGPNSGSFQYGGCGLSLAGNAPGVLGNLYANGLQQGNNEFGKMSIPAPTGPNGTYLGTETAGELVSGMTQIQNFGSLGGINTVIAEGSLEYQGRVFFTAAISYDGGGEQNAFMVCGSPTVSGGQWTGLGDPLNAQGDSTYLPGSSPTSLHNRMESHSSNIVPALWQPLLGGPAYMSGGAGGGAGLSIISRQCCGHGFCTWNPASVSGGKGLKLNCTFTGGALTAVSINAAGSGYFASATIPMVVIGLDASTSRTLSVNATVNVTTNGSGVPISVTITNAGSGYSSGNGVANPAAASPIVQFTEWVNFPYNNQGDNSGLTTSILYGKYQTRQSNWAPNPGSGYDDIITIYTGPVGHTWIVPGSRTLLAIHHHMFGPETGAGTDPCNSTASGANDAPVSPDFKGYKRVQLVAYDMAAVVANKQAGKGPDQNVPYAWWEFPNWKTYWGTPANDHCPLSWSYGWQTNGFATFDYANNLLYVSDSGSFGGANGQIYVFRCQK
jgi:hypothetical protein